jgi:hypothetical protein
MNTVIAQDLTGYVYDQSNVLQVKYAIINAASSGNNTLVAAVTGKKIRVISMFLTTDAAVTATIQSGAGGTALVGALSLGDSTGTNAPGFVLGENTHGWFQTAAGALLNLNLSGAVQVSGCLSYVEAN